MQRAKLKFMNLFTTICVTRLRRDSGKERHYQASYSPPAGYALFQHSRAKRITRSLKENAAPPFGSRLLVGTVGVWPEMERKKADCRSRWKTFKPRLLARGKQKRPGWKFPAAGRAPARSRARPRGDPGAGFGPMSLRPSEEHCGSASGWDAPRSPQFGPRGSQSGLWAKSPQRCRGILLLQRITPRASWSGSWGLARSSQHMVTSPASRKAGLSSFWYRRDKRRSLAGSTPPNQRQLLSSLKINIKGPRL